MPSAPPNSGMSLPARPLQRLWMRGLRLAKERPLLAKALPTCCGFAAGDLLTQHFNQPPGRSLLDGGYQPARTVAMAAVGATLAAPIGLAFLRWLDVVLPSSPLALKLALGEVLGCALWQAAYIAISPPYRQGAIKLAKGAQQRLLRTTSAPAAKKLS